MKPATNKLSKVKVILIPLFLGVFLGALITTSIYVQPQSTNDQQAQTQPTPNNLSKYTVPVQILPPHAAKSTPDEEAATPPQTDWQSQTQQPTQPAATTPPKEKEYVPLYKKDVWEKLRVPPRDKPSSQATAPTEPQATNEQTQSPRVNIYK